jgi:hypothetical protein
VDFVHLTTDPVRSPFPSRQDFARARFFEEEYKSKGLGLVNLAKTLFTPACKAASTHMSLPWLLWGLLFSQLLLELPKAQQQSLCSLIYLLVSKMGMRRNIPIPIPTTHRQARSFYLRTSSHSSRNPSLLEQFSLMKPLHLDGKHVYIPVTNTIRFIHAIGHILEPAHLIDVHNSTVYSSGFIHSRTPRGLELLRRCLLGLGFSDVPAYLTQNSISQCRSPPTKSVYTRWIIGHYHLMFWSDSFEAFHTKQNRGSVWVMFVSVATPSSSPISLQNTFNSGMNTFLVAMGPSGKSVSHDSVFSALADDMKQLCDPQIPFSTFSRYHSRECKSIFSIYCYNQDTPERTESNGIASWKANNTVLSGYVCALVDKQHLLPSCRLCHKFRLGSKYMDGIPPRRCQACLDWDPPHPIPITYSGLESLVRSLLQHQLSGLGSTRATIVETLRDAGVSPPVANTIATGLSSPSPYLPQLPAQWKLSPYCEVKDSTEVIMHLLFLGIVRAHLKEIVYTFLSGRKQWTAFVLRTKRLLIMVRCMSLSWFKPHPIPASGTFGGWVSENYLAYARMYKYAAAFVQRLPQNDDPYQDPTGPPSKLFIPALQQWLVSRGLKVRKPTGQLRARKADYVKTVERTGWTTAGDPPPPLANPTAGIPLDVFEDSVISMHNLVASIMSLRDLPTVEQSFDLLRCIKLYLTFDDYFLRYSGERDTITVVAPDSDSVRIEIRQDSEPTLREELDESDDDTLGSVSDDSGDDGFATPNNHVPTQAGEGVASSLSSASTEGTSNKRGRIPALSKRNKYNLITLVDTICHYGPYMYNSELGPKGEGAIRTVKPIVASRGVQVRSDQFLHATQQWTALRFSKSAIGMAVDAMQSSITANPRPVVDDPEHDFFQVALEMFSHHLIPTGDSMEGVRGWEDDSTVHPPVDQEAWEDSFATVTAPSDERDPPASTNNKKMYETYPDRSSIPLLTAGETPISIVIFNSINDTDDCIRYGAVYVGSQELEYIVPILPECHVTTQMGAVFHRWIPLSGTHEHDCPKFSCRILDYGVMLPCTATLHGRSYVVYHTITYGWKEVLEDFTLGFQRQAERSTGDFNSSYVLTVPAQ